ncbi:DUF2264 domain-containing protein [Streptomyces sp. NPDC048340]|uniref:DUF2264 domain-containing protein n=1 Tax=Streptomyces sp. NPDC048340 TaxID=3365537 RepID=UPI0037226E80
MMFELPPEDRALSPVTGYTRDHWEALADALVRAARRCATPGGALLDLPGRPSSSGTRSDGLEGYARTFLAVAFRTAGAQGRDPLGLLEPYADGLAAGTRTPGREDAESWPLVLDYTVQGQPMVEAASVALALRLTRRWLWDRLDGAVQDRAEAWLRGALRHRPVPNNWYLFPLTVAGFLDSVGRGDGETHGAVQRGLDLLEAWYRGDGWYSDGEGRAFDHYNGWALHFYPVLHAWLADDRHLLELLGPRLRSHLDGYGLLFGSDGAPVHFGRSLTYRFAAGAAVGLGALTGHTPLPAGASRTLVSGCLRHFLDRGALDGDGLLPPGWYGPHEATLQGYSGPASPYWASKAFVSLLAPADHPLWTRCEEPPPVAGPDRALALRAPGLLIQTTGGDGGPGARAGARAAGHRVHAPGAGAPALGRGRRDGHLRGARLARGAAGRRPTVRRGPGDRRGPGRRRSPLELRRPSHTHRLRSALPGLAARYGRRSGRPKLLIVPAANRPGLRTTRQPRTLLLPYRMSRGNTCSSP